MEIFVINLVRSTERRQRIEARLAGLGLSFKFFAAVDAATGEHTRFANYDEAAFRRHWRKTLSPGEAACLASHYSLWVRCRDGGRPIVILEDDALVDERFPDALAVLPVALARFGYIRLSAFKPRRMQPIAAPELPEGWSLAGFSKGPLGMAGYAITPTAAARFVKHAQTFLEPADIYADHFWLHGLPPVALLPLTVAQDGIDSTIDTRGDRRPGFGWRVRRLLRKAADNFLRVLWLGTSAHWHHEARRRLPEQG